MSSGVRLAQTVSKTVASEANGLGSTPSCSTNLETDMEKKIDFELLTVIDESIGDSASYVDALDKVIKWEKENRGLKGFHVSAPLDVMCGTRKVEDPEKEAEEMARGVLLMHRAGALGKWKEISGDELERM